MGSPQWNKTALIANWHISLCLKRNVLLFIAIKGLKLMLMVALVMCNVHNIEQRENQQQCLRSRWSICCSVITQTSETFWLLLANLSLFPHPLSLHVPLSCPPWVMFATQFGKCKLVLIIINIYHVCENVFSLVLLICRVNKCLLKALRCSPRSTAD